MQPSDGNRPISQATGGALIIVGVALVLLSLFADRVNLGGGEGFGYQQLIVMIIGIVVILVGIRALLQPMLQDHPGRDNPDS